MSDIDSLLNMSTAEFKEPPKLPAGYYILEIQDAKVVPFLWKAKSDKPERKGKGVAFVTAPVDCLDAQGDSDTAATMRQALEEFGDWRARKFVGTYSTKDQPPVEMLGVSPTSFALVMDDNSPAPGAFNFYSNVDGKQSGFAYDVLGLDFPNGATVGEVITASMGKRFLAEIGYRTDQEGKVLPFPEIKSVAMLP